MNKLLVEGKTDKIFFEYLLREKAEVENFCIDVCELNGIGNLEKKINELKFERLNKLGIVLDGDNIGIDGRLEEIKKIFLKKEIDISCEENGQICEFDELKIGCFIIENNLESLLIDIIKTDKKSAECLKEWSDCCKCIEKSEYNKLFLEVFYKYDMCSKEERKKAKECNLKKALEKGIFEISSLKKLKIFLDDLFER